MGIYDTENSVITSFDADFIPEELLQAQWAEFIELKKIIAEQFSIKKRALSILDIGIGSARIVKHLSPIKEIWDLIGTYDGIDNAIPCINISKKAVVDLNIGDKFSVIFLEADKLDSLH